MELDHHPASTTSRPLMVLIADHGLFDSFCFRDPNGYVVERACPRDTQRDGKVPARNGVRAMFDRWMAAKAASTRWVQPH